MKVGIFLSSIVTDFLTLIYNFIPRRQARFGIFDGQIRLRDFNIGPGAGLHKGFAARMLAHMQVGGHARCSACRRCFNSTLKKCYSLKARGGKTIP